MLTFLISSIRLSAVFLFGSTGEIITEKSGHLNLGIPGIMCVGAAGGYLGEALYVNSNKGNNINWFLSIFIALIFSLLFSALMGLLYSFLTVTLRSNQNITGLAITTFGVGISKFVVHMLTAKGLTEHMAKGAVMFRTLFTFYPKLGWFGELFLSYGILVYLAIIVAVITALVLKKTRVGLSLRSVGENPATADAVGINVGKYRYLATIIGSMIAGLGGLFYIMDYIGGNWEYCIDTYGWLAVALVIFTVWKPNFAIVGSLLFAGLYILPNYIGSVSTANKELIKMLPYLVTIVVLVVTSKFGSKTIQPPQSLGTNYFREDR